MYFGPQAKYDSDGKGGRLRQKGLEIDLPPDDEGVRGPHSALSMDEAWAEELAKETLELPLVLSEEQEQERVGDTASTPPITAALNPDAGAVTDEATVQEVEAKNTGTPISKFFPASDCDKAGYGHARLASWLIQEQERSAGISPTELATVQASETRRGSDSRHRYLRGCLFDRDDKF